MEIEQNKLKLKIVNQKNFIETEGTPKELLNIIRDQVQIKKKWFYLDGLYTNPEDISIEDICQSTDLMLTNELGGGH